MKLKFILSLALAGASLPLFAQGYKDGVEFYKADRVEEAEELLQRNLNSAETNLSEAYYYLGQIQLARYYNAKRNNRPAQNYLQEAASYFDKGAAQDPKNPFNYVGQGNIALINSNSKAAEELFKQAEKLGKNDAGVWAAVGRAYYDVNPTLYAKQLEKAVAQGEKLVLKQSISSNPKWAANDQDFYMFQGDMAFDAAAGDSKKVGDACNFYESAIRVNPDAAEGYIKYADKLLAIKRVQQAEAQLRTLLKENPNSALGQRKLADILYNDGQIAKGIEEYGKLMKNPNHFNADETTYLTLLYFTKDNQRGYDEATSILARNPDNFNVRRFQYIFANALNRPDRVQLAEQLLKLKSDKNRFATGDYSMIAEELNKDGRPEEATAVLQMGLKDYPEEIDMLKTVAQSLYRIDKEDEAADMMADYVAKKGADVTGTEYNSLSDYAVIAAQKATEPDVKAKYIALSADAAQKAAPKLSDKYKYIAAKRLGDIAALQGNVDQALTEYSKALDLLQAAGDQAEASAIASLNRAVGIMLIQEKRNAEAKPYIQRYVELNPDDAQMVDILSKLK